VPKDRICPMWLICRMSQNNFKCHHAQLHHHEAHECYHWYKCEYHGKCSVTKDGTHCLRIKQGGCVDVKSVKDGGETDDSERCEKLSE
jgi:hypothetical protein